MFPDIDGDIASTQVISNSYLTIGIDRLAAGKKSFINFTENLLLSKTPYMCPSDTTVIEIVENVNVSEELILSVKKLKRKGYTIALDDFIYSDDYLPLLQLVDIVKMQTGGWLIKNKENGICLLSLR